MNFVVALFESIGLAGCLPMVPTDLVQLVVNLRFTFQLKILH